MLYKVLLIIAHLSMISSSLVVDSTAQRSVYVTDYCPSMQYCPEGGHVMCMYYNTKSKMGPRCNNAQNITMTPELANKLVDVSNAVRSRIALGKEKGKNGEFLPRGYGIFRLNWDTELATFAQVLANQCVLRHDLCRATKRFPDPGQTAGLVRFSYPDWFPVSKSGNFTMPGLSPAKLMYATTQILKSWYGQKNSVTPNMITYYPDWTLNPTSQSGRLYLEMIYASATHMGCGISAYTEYAFYDNNAALNYNVIYTASGGNFCLHYRDAAEETILDGALEHLYHNLSSVGLIHRKDMSVQIICNYSARPRKETAVYNTVPPGDTAAFSCGCPVGSEANDECLCHEVEKQPIHHIEQLKKATRKCPAGQVCDPTVVVLPIFTVEDAPPEKLFTHESFTNTSIRKQIEDAMFQGSKNDLFHSKRNFYAADQIVNKTQEYGSKGETQKQSRSQNIRPTHHQTIAVRNRYFDKKHIETKPEERELPPRAIHNVVRKKTSLFSRAAKFELPGTLSIRPMKPAGTIDVVPRKDFSTAKQLVNKYLFGKNDLMKPQYKSKAMSEEKKTFNEHELSNEPLMREVIGDSQRKHNLMKPLYKEVKNTFSKQDQLKAETKNEKNVAEEHETFNNFIGKEHNFHEVFNILNATKPLKVSKDVAIYQKIRRPSTETVLNTAEQKLISQDLFLQQIVSNTNDYKPLNSVTEETDNKLMALLDTLEQEVKHVELREKDKQLFDAKIRKIYGKVVGKPVSLLDFNINKHDTKSNENIFADTVKNTHVIQKYVQQDRKEEPLYEKYKIKVEGPDELHDQRRDFIDSKSMYSMYKYRNNSTSDRNEIDKYDEGNSYKKSYGLRGMKHSDISHEQIRSRYRDYENDHDYGERKKYSNNDFDRNALEDEPTHRETNKYRGRKTERDRHRDDEVDHRNTNDLEHRGRNNLGYHHRNDGIDPIIRNKNYYLHNDAANDDPLSVERRRFYQNKLENIERRIQMRSRKRKKDNSRHMRPMRPASRKSESQMDIYGRGRFAHGY